MKAWHYTTGQKARLIEAFGALHPTAVGIHPHERPVLWFSLNQCLERTALKGLRSPDGTTRTATVEEMKHFGEGLVRYGVAPQALLSGEALRRAARTPPKVWRLLSEIALRDGANPGEWMGSIEPIEVHRLTIEVMDDAGNWIEARGQHEPRG